MNGLDVERLAGTVEAIKQRPDLGRFQFRARNRWVGGGETRSSIRDFYGAGQEDTSRAQAFEVTSDEPAVLLGGNAGANPAEHLLHALAGCVTTTFVLHATARGVNVRSISTTLEGDVDLQGPLDLDPAVSPAYEGIRVKIDVQADCSDEELEEMLAYTRAHSTITQTISRPIPVTLDRAA